MHSLWRATAGVFLGSALLLASGPGKPAAITPIDQAFNRLYNFDFAGTHRILDEYQRKEPGQPMTEAVRASALLFQELHRLQILEGAFFQDDKKFKEKKRLSPDPAVKDRFFVAVAETQRLAEAQLARNNENRDALFALSLASGLLGDYHALVDKRYPTSLTNLKQSHTLALRLIKKDPNYHDAYLTTGFSEYLLSSLPFFLRWFVRFEEVDGDKERALRNLERVAASGRYLKGFAKILLSTFYLREKRPDQSQRLLAELLRDYPENTHIRKQLELLSQRNPRPAD